MCELQPIIMAAGTGSRVQDLVTRTPKALLPIANKPMVWYPVNMLAKAGFKQATIVVTESHHDAIQKSLVEINQVKITLEFACIPDDQDWSTADSLRHIGVKGEGDMLIISCDLITDVSIQQFADLHRKKNATVTMLLASMPETKGLQVPGGKANNKIEIDYIGLEKENEDLKEEGSRVGYLAAEADLNGTISVSQTFVTQHPNVMLRADRCDAHMYLISHSILSYLQEEPAVSAIKGELLPKIVRNHLKTDEQEEDIEETALCDSYDEDKGVADGALQELSLKWSTYPPAKNNTRFKVHAYMQDAGYCVRANSILTYCEANRSVPRELMTEDGDETKFQPIHPTVKANRRNITDSIVGEGTTIGEKVTIQKSTIGRHCIIKDNVKITNSIIMDYTVVEAGSTIAGSVISSHVEIAEKCEISGTVVAEGMKLSAERKYSNEAVTDWEEMII